MVSGLFQDGARKKRLRSREPNPEEEVAHEILERARKPNPLSCSWCVSWASGTTAPRATTDGNWIAHRRVFQSRKAAANALSAWVRGTWRMAQVASVPSTGFRSR